MSRSTAAYRRTAPPALRRALPAWLTAPAAAFTRTDAVRVLDTVKVQHGPVAANRLRAVGVLGPKRPGVEVRLPAAVVDAALRKVA